MFCQHAAAINRTMFIAAISVGAGGIGGCGYDPVGPDPLPWTPSPEAQSQRVALAPNSASGLRASLPSWPQAQVLQRTD